MSDGDRLPDEGPRQPKNRLALAVHYEGAEQIWLELDAGAELEALVAGLARMFKEPLFHHGSPLRLWHLLDGEQRAVGVNDPEITSTNPREPIGAFLALEEMHSVTLARDAPPIRGAA